MIDYLPLMRKLPEVKFLVNKIRKAERIWHRKLQLNMKIYRCCSCKPLGSNDQPFHFSAKSQRKAIMEGYNEITGLKGNENDRLSQFVCWS